MCSRYVVCERPAPAESIVSARDLKIPCLHATLQIMPFTQRFFISMFDGLSRDDLSFIHFFNPYFTNLNHTI
jgi:hypothetical protein